MCTMLMDNSLVLCVLYNILLVTLSLQHTTDHFQRAVQPVIRDTPELSFQTQQHITERDSTSETQKATIKVSVSDECFENVTISVQGLSGFIHLVQNKTSFNSWKCEFKLCIPSHKIMRFRVVDCYGGISLKLSDYFSVIRNNALDIPCSRYKYLPFLYSMTDTVMVKASYNYSYTSMKPFGRFKLHFCTVHRSARRTVEVEIIHLSSAAGYLQTPGWDTYTKQLNEFMRSCVTLTRPTDHVIFVSPVIWSVKSISTYIGHCGLRQRFLKEPKLHSFPLFLFPDDFAKTANNESHLSFFFSGKYFSWTQASFRLHFSFHIENLKPQQVPSSPPQSHGRKTRWNCSVSVWPDLFDHFPCDLIPQCAESEDEARCNYTTENCGLGKAEISGKCYSFELQVEQHNWTDAHEHCRERGAFLVSLETEQEIRDVVKVMKDIGNTATWVGLTTGTNTVKTSLNAMYQNTLRWDSSNIVFMLPPSVVFDPYTAVATLDCLILIWTRAIYYLHFQTCDTEEEIGILCELPTSSYHHLAPKPVIIRVPNETSMSRVPLVTCPLQHMTHELLACDSKSLCNRLESADEWYRGTCSMPLGQTHEYFYCGTCDKFVPYSVVCDFREDCIGGDDEDFCVHPTCKTHMMDCGKGQCIDSDKRCNGYKDCISNLDETDCPVEYAISNIIPPAVVNFDKPGGFTITSLPENNTQCPDTHFQCHNDGYCLPVYVKCNDVNDCPDHEDEVECNKYTCPGFYRCRGSDKTICMHVDHLCDGLAQCPMHDDETLCDLICPEACSCFGLAFTCIQPLNFSSFPQLRYLEAKGSGLDQTDVGDNIMLIHLGVEACGWKSLTDLILPNLHSLDLSNNLFRSVNFSHLARMRHLRSLNLAGNPISGTVFDVLQKYMYISFKVFNLSRVQADSLNMSILSTAMPNVEVLDLSWNNIKSLQGRGLFQTLRVLNLQGNPVNDFSPDVMKSMTFLVRIYAQNFKLCCSVVLPDIFRGECLAPSDEISSCDDLLKSMAYRCALAVFAVLATLGNFVGFVYRLYFLLKGTNTGFAVFVLHLCVSDLLMGVYLAFIGVADQIFAGIYVWNETAWKKSSFCTTAGFLSFLSSEVSAFLVCLITLDRFLVLHFPFSQIRFGTTSAHRACIIIWTLGLILAAVPLLPVTSHWEFYQQTGICIPLPITRAVFAGHTYSFSVMVICNLVLFLLIAMGQSLIYWTVRGNAMSQQVTRTKNTGADSIQSKEAAIARRLLTIAMSDFLCWFPIGLCGVLAAMDVIIPGEINVAMAIFVLPLNSALNPFLYTLNVIREKHQKAKELRLLQILRAQQKK